MTITSTLSSPSPISPAVISIGFPAAEGAPQSSRGRRRCQVHSVNPSYLRLPIQLPTSCPPSVPLRAESSTEWKPLQMHRLEDGTVADELTRLGAHRALVRAAEQGRIKELACSMPICHKPNRGYFDPEGGNNDWALSACQRCRVGRAPFGRLEPDLRPTPGVASLTFSDPSEDGRSSRGFRHGRPLPW